MPHDLDLTPLAHAAEGGAPAPASGEIDLTQLDRLTAVVVELAVEVGRTKMSLGQAMSLGPGSVVTLDRLADQPVDLLVNGKPIARGEVVVIDEQFGVRITDVVQSTAGTAVARIGEAAA
jgi:flagellar motor switch protein FliN